jgi:CheY-like chemotaxis protein
MKNILAIDDQINICQIIKHGLETTGKYRVFTATRGRDGIRLAQHIKPDIILLDIDMPEMNGGETAEYLRNYKSTQNIPIIFLTAIVKANEINKINESIEDYVFLAKPVSIKQLIDTIESVLLYRCVPFSRKDSNDCPFLQPQTYVLERFE